MTQLKTFSSFFVVSLVFFSLARRDSINRLLDLKRSAKFLSKLTLSCILSTNKR
jgi:hypothetical protein